MSSFLLSPKVHLWPSSKEHNIPVAFAAAPSVIILGHVPFTFLLLPPPPILILIVFKLFIHSLIADDNWLSILSARQSEIIFE